MRNGREMSEMEIRKSDVGYAVVTNGKFIIAKGNRPLAAVQELMRQATELLDVAVRLEGEITSRTLLSEKAEIEERAVEDFLHRVDKARAT